MRSIKIIESNFPFFIGRTGCFSALTAVGCHLSGTFFPKSAFKGTPTCASSWSVSKSTKSCHFKRKRLWEFNLLIMSYHLQGMCSGYFSASFAVSFQCGFIEATRTLDLQNCLAQRQVLFLACIDTEQSGKQPACWILCFVWTYWEEFSNHLFICSLQFALGKE